MKPISDPQETDTRRGFWIARAGELLIAGIALASLSVATCAVTAEVLDDFEDPARFRQVWTTDCYGTCDHVLANGQIRLSVTPSGDHGFSTLRSARRWLVREGRTLEFRVDLVSSSGDGAMVRMGFGLGDGERGYGLSVDQDTVVLGKRDSPVVQCFVLANDVLLRSPNRSTNDRADSAWRFPRPQSSSSSS